MTYFETAPYRSLINTSDLEKFELLVKETNLLILFKQNSLNNMWETSPDVDATTHHELKNIAYRSLLNCRRQIENYIESYPSFQKSYAPVKVKNGPSK